MRRGVFPVINLRRYASGDLYSVQMKACSRWLADQVKTHSKAQFKRLVRERIGDWTEAFQTGPT